jgi:hypothetical protein
LWHYSREEGKSQYLSYFSSKLPTKGKPGYNFGVFIGAQLPKWFIATRSVVGTIILYLGLIGGLLASQYLYANGNPKPISS